jgi:hypothetical protein
MHVFTHSQRVYMCALADVLAKHYSRTGGPDCDIQKSTIRYRRTTGITHLGPLVKAAR